MSKTIVRMIGRIIIWVLKLDLLIPGGIGFGYRPYSNEEYKRLVRELLDKDDEIEIKISKAIESLQSTSNLLGELDNILNDRKDKLSKIQEEIESQSKLVKDYMQLAEIGRNNAEPIINSIKSSVNEGKNLERIINFIISIVSGILVFLLGFYWKEIIGLFS
ncbi:hypothetical protein [Paenibacillus sp.]|uniref:hypothetical protein n=1 Tax=Paenibacillus sp. TaxID=58172 RepID=UPI002D415C49|nr:hypothetical protein [Paenibacillus sp.]HZG87832.1 hypothetical protein [Paenibacillus sp.]